MILRKTPGEIELMHAAGRVVAAALDAAQAAARPGVTTAEIDAVVEDVIRSSGCVPSFKGYNGFPGSACLSLNEEVVHGIPGPRVLVDGDVLKVDVGAIRDGFHADAARSVYVGDEAPDGIEKLLRVTEDALWAGIRGARRGARVSDIGAAIETVAEGAGFRVVREYVGHGLGRSLHEDPGVPNHGPPGEGPILLDGMTLAIEPMVNAGGWETLVLADDWTVVTADGSLSAHFEHSVAVIGDEPLVLTLP